MKFNFDKAFELLTGNRPYPWQRNLFARFVHSELPECIDIPTGLGKTATMAVWLLARAAGASLPRRLVYVVDRRVIVDQATDTAEQLRKQLEQHSDNVDIAVVRDNLELRNSQLAISTLRGQYLDNREWLTDPVGSAVVIGTVDMVGSRLLFEGYSVSRTMRPNQAGLLGCDTLVLLDEAHLSCPFQQLLRTIERGQCADARDVKGEMDGAFSGSRVTQHFPPKFRVVSLSATPSADISSTPFSLDAEDLENDRVRNRIHAVKDLMVRQLGTDTKLEEELAGIAQKLAVPDDEKGESTGKRVLVYCDRREIASAVEKLLVTPQREPLKVILFVGGRRVHERELAAKELRNSGMLASSTVDSVNGGAVIVVATSAGEVGVDLDADHLVCDVVAWERMVQRFGRVNRTGKHPATITVVDQGASPEEDRRCEIHKAVLQLLKQLPQGTVDGSVSASPQALGDLNGDASNKKTVKLATSDVSIYPPLTRALVDAWSMTSLPQHEGRPEVSPWIRGWPDEPRPQTAVVWRQFLPFSYSYHVGVLDAKPEYDAGAAKKFFQNAQPRAEEKLETETYRVAEWLKKRALKIEKHASNGPSSQPQDVGDHKEEDEHSVKGHPFPLRLDPELFAVLLGDDDDHPIALGVAECRNWSRNKLEQELKGKILVVDRRIGGLRKTGLLDVESDEVPSSIDDNWNSDQDENEGTIKGEPQIRIRVVRSGEVTETQPETEYLRAGSGRPLGMWTAHEMPHCFDGGEEPAFILIVEKTRHEEDGRAFSSTPQSLCDHHKRIVEEAERIADSLGFPDEFRQILTTAAAHHDSGKKSERWQRAFSASEEGRPYAKTSGPILQKELAGFRHEFQSVLDLKSERSEIPSMSADDFDLVLHIVAAHHGRARPVISANGCDSIPPIIAQNECMDIALRFARVQRHWGPWGLAWWEALLRAADRRASEGGDDA